MNDKGDQFAGPIQRPVLITPDGYAGVVYGGVVYPLTAGSQIDIAGPFWEQAECHKFLESGADIPYAPKGHTPPGGPAADVRTSEAIADLSVHAVPCPRWIDAFPWLQQASSPRTQPWWENGLDSGPQEERLGLIADLAIDHLQGWSVGVVFPWLPLEVEAGQLKLPTRARRLLMEYARRSEVRLKDLVTLEVGEMLDWRNMGMTTAHVLLRELARACLRDMSPESSSASASASRNEIPTEQEVRGESQLEWFNRLCDDAAAVAGWYSALGMPAEPLLAGPTPPGTPTEVLEARHRLEALTAADVLTKEEAAVDLASMLNDVLQRLEERELLILTRRLFAERRATLDEIGKELGVTRERVRQLERKARQAVENLAAGTPALRVAMSAIGPLIGRVCPLQSLIPKVPALRRRVEIVGLPAWLVLDRLDDAYEIADGWCAAPSVQAAKADTRVQLEQLADHHGVVELSEVELFDVGDQDVNLAFLEEWVAYCGFIVDDAFVLTRTSNIEDYAAAILSTAGAPMTTSQIQARMTNQRAESSIRNQLSLDERFGRVDRDVWALREWGFEEYGNIRSAIRDEIADNGGEMKLSDLVEQITGKYSVSAKSIVIYAGTPPFETSAGLVRRTTSGYQARKTPDQTRRLYRRPDAWMYRIRVSGEHLRGSGSPLPVAIASILDLQPGTALELDSPLGPQAVTWLGGQPAIGSVRRFVLDSGVQPDSHAFLVFGDDHTFDFLPAPEPDDDPVAKALALIGASSATDPGGAQRALACALGLPDSTSMPDLIRTFQQRGDTDIALLLADARGRGPRT